MLTSLLLDLNKSQQDLMYMHVLETPPDTLAYVLKKSEINRNILAIEKCLRDGGHYGC